LSIRRALGDAKLTRDSIDEVILVGGATRMPLVVRRVRELFGKGRATCRVYFSKKPKKCVDDSTSSFTIAI
jgi:molecular chaperone DnaK (HSP70)